MRRPTLSPAAVRHLVCAFVILMAACDSPTAPSGPETEVIDEFRADGILMTAAVSSLAGNAIEVTLTAMNETDFEAQTAILGGNCMFRPRVYTERGGRLVWSAFDLFDACQQPALIFQLGGGDEESVSREFVVDADEGDYFVTLTIVHATLVELAAGEVSVR